MRILTVRQPWADAIIRHGKDVENRSRNIAGAYRGPVAIHAGMQSDDAWRFGNPTGVVLANAREQSEPEWRSRIRRSGAIIGIVDLVDVHASESDDLGRMICRPGTADWGFECSPWAITDHQHLVLANPRALATPIPAKGRLGLWKPEPDLEHAITTALATTSGDPS